MVQRSNLEEIAKEFGNQRKYKLVEFKGKGGFKECFHIIDSSDKEFALKIIDIQNSNLIRLEREMLIMANCDSKLISKLYEFGTFINKESESYSFSIEEYLDGGTLEEKMRNKLPREFILELAINLTEALIYIKDKNVVHRDIKPANILFRKNSNLPVLVDFGIARDLNKSSLTPTWSISGPGTPLFSSPEQLNNEKNLIDWRTDQFSLGLIIGFCILDKHPFEGVKGKDAVTAVAEKNNCSREFITKAKELKLEGVLKMLEPWPHRRYQKPEELINILKNARQ